MYSLIREKERWKRSRKGRSGGKIKGEILLFFFLSPLVLLQCVTVSTRWQKGFCSITLSSETEIRVLSLEPHGTHIHPHAHSFRVHTYSHTFLPSAHWTLMHPHTLRSSLNNQKMPGWLAACSGASLTWIPSDACFCTPIIQLGGGMARALLHTLVRSCAKTPGHGLIVREGIHYTMLPACTDEKRQGVTCGAS